VPFRAELEAAYSRYCKEFSTVFQERAELEAAYSRYRKESLLSSRRGLN
jgi:hypothetical protein